MDINEKVLSVLKESDTPLKAAELAEKLNIDKKDVDKAIKKLKTDSLIESPKRCYYSAVMVEEELDLEAKMLKVLKESNEPLKVADLAEKLGEDKKEVDKYIKKLKKEEKIVSPKRCYYSAS
jgi:predicted transcriptional regulator